MHFDHFFPRLEDTLIPKHILYTSVEGRCLLSLFTPFLIQFSPLKKNKKSIVWDPKPGPTTVTLNFFHTSRYRILLGTYIAADFISVISVKVNGTEKKEETEDKKEEEKENKEVGTYLIKSKTLMMKGVYITDSVPKIRLKYKVPICENNDLLIEVNSSNMIN